MPGTLGDRVFVLDQFLNVPVCKSRAQHVLGVEVLDCRRPAGAVFQLLGCVAQQQDVAAGAGQLFHHLELAVTPLRPDELNEDTDYPVKGALLIVGWKAGGKHVSLDEFDYLTQNYHPVYPQSADLSLEQVNVITRTLESSEKDRARRITALAKKVQELLSVTPREGNQEKFLQTILRDYQYYALEEI